MSIWERYLALTFLDLIRAKGEACTLPKSTEETTETSTQASTTTPLFALPLGSCSSLEIRFVTNAWGLVRCYLQRKGFSLERTQFIAYVAPIAAAAGTSVPIDELQELLVGPLEKSFAVKQPEDEFSYFDFTKTLAEACVELIPLVVPDLFPEAPCLTVLTNVPIGADFMIPFDYCFETDPSASRISHPDFNWLCESLDHSNWYFKNPAIKHWQTRQHFAYLPEVVMCMPHEVVHVYQGVAKQRDSSNAKWSSEHDASVVALSFLHCLATDRDMANKSEKIKKAQDLLANGVYEAAILGANAQQDCFVSELDENAALEYVKLKESNGVHDPAIKEMDSRAASVYKDSLPRDNFHDTTPKFTLQFSMLFKDRFDVDCFTTPAPTVPDELKVQTAWIQRSPCSISELVEFDRRVSKV